MNNHACMLLLALLTAACTGRTSVQPGMPSPHYGPVNDRLAGRTVTARYDDGRTTELQDVQLATDSATGSTYLFANGRRIAPLTSVIRLETRSRVMGALQGAGIGAASAGLYFLGLVAGLGSAQLDWEVVKGVAPQGAAYGVIIGAIRGARRIYDIQVVVGATTASLRPAAACAPPFSCR